MAIVGVSTIRHGTRMRGREYEQWASSWASVAVGKSRAGVKTQGPLFAPSGVPPTATDAHEESMADDTIDFTNPNLNDAALETRAGQSRASILSAKVWSK